MDRTKQRTVVGLIAVVGLMAAVALALFGLPYGKANPQAFAHTYTHPSTKTVHLHIDADITDGNRPCDPITTSATVTVGSSHQVGLCVEDYVANEVAAFDLVVLSDMDDQLNFAPDPDGDEEPQHGGAIAVGNLDDNPDANDGDDATGFKLGGGWDCTGLNVFPPRSEIRPIRIVCTAAFVGPDQDLTANPGLLATISFDAIAAGTENLSFDPSTGLGLDSGNTDCGQAGGGTDMGCFGAELIKVPDIGLTKSATPDPAIAGSDVVFDFNLTGGPGAVLVFDDLDNDLVFNAAGSDPSCLLVVPPGAPSPGVPEPVGGDGTNIVMCGPFAVPGVVSPGIAAFVPLAEAGKQVSNGAIISPGDPNFINDGDFIVVDVAPADVSVDKVADAAIYSEGDQITWTVTYTSNGPSPASSVVLSDTVGANQAIVSADVDGPENCTETASTAAQVVGQTATCTLDSPIAAGDDVVLTVVTDVVTSVGNQCTNTGDVQWADPLTASTGPVNVVCLPPTVRMEKDIDEDSVSIDKFVNLFIEKDGAGGWEPLVIYELVTNAGNDPDGVGAYEFQLKFDHKLFDIVIEDSSWLSNGGTRSVDCSNTIITENYILWGCVSSGPTPGQTANGTAAIITVYPEPDMHARLTPGQNNGVVGKLLDENCELADVLGDPLRISTGELAPGILPGGLVEVCSDMVITIRILEGDLNLDCVVDVTDTQAIAFRYGAFFGNLLYSPWYDLEPALKDFDIDIKDLQKVWGRLGSVCDINGVGTIPPQLPAEFP